MNVTIFNQTISLNLNDKISFKYNGKIRIGRIEKLKAEYLTLESTDGGFKSFRFEKFESAPRMLSTADGKSGFVEGLKEIQNGDSLVKL